MGTKVTGKVDAEMNLLKENQELRRELDLFKTRSPLVGVRWFGRGGFKIGLTYLIGGQDRIILEGRNDCGVIDLSSWNRVRNTEEANAGILIRDDRVITEKGVIGVVAPPEKKVNPNAYPVDKVVGAFSSVKKLKPIVKSFTHHFPARHFLETAKENNINDKNKIDIVYDKYKLLFTRFRVRMLHRHDLTHACELNGIPFEALSINEMVEKVTEIEVQNYTPEPGYF